MKILVIGSGGREHALVWKIKQSPLVEKIYCAPGNPGIARLAQCVDIKADDIGALADFACENKIDLTVVGPELPLTLGIADEFERRGLAVFGVNKKSAQLEGSKVFMKALLHKYKIPTAEYNVFNDPHKAKEYIEKKGAPLVVKADGLAAGKGVVVCWDTKTALDAVAEIMEKKIFGGAGSQIIVEECLVGEEISFLAFADGKRVLPMVSAQDHKAAYDNDKGPNTGGMGAYSPAPLVDEALHNKIMSRVMNPAIEALKAEGCDYRGVLYAGLMIVKGEPYVLEFNARFGDPETQVILPRLESDIVPVFMAIAKGNLAGVELKWRQEAAVCVVLAAGGYPGSYEKNDPIDGLDSFDNDRDVILFHAGTSEKDGKIVTGGGRVLGLTALGGGLAQAIERAYRSVGNVRFKNMHYRKDIGQKGLNKSK